MSRGRVAVAAVLSASAAGCALVTATPPTVEVATVELRGLGPLDRALGVTLCVSNPNDAELSFRRVTVAMDVAGAPLAEGASEAPVRLPPRSLVLGPGAVHRRDHGAQSRPTVARRRAGRRYLVRYLVQAARRGALRRRPRLAVQPHWTIGPADRRRGVARRRRRARGIALRRGRGLSGFTPPGPSVAQTA